MTTINKILGINYDNEQIKVLTEVKFHCLKLSNRNVRLIYACRIS